MTVNKFKRKSVSLDDVSVDRCKLLARDLSTSMSGLLRLIIKDAFDEYQRITGEQKSNPPPLL
jgi:hypothetical protein